MIIDIEYEVGLGGNVFVTKNDEPFDFEIIEFEENDYADIGIEVIGHGENWIINDVYNRNALPNPRDLSDKNLSVDEYDKIFKDIKSQVIGTIRINVESFFENN